ncbi:MAG: hypothetical protein QNJ38_00885 [Prochloraceae cyanobacterium]|nr:hypothetical protein [Prochloraceae cyanobacterium]
MLKPILNQLKNIHFSLRSFVARESDMWLLYKLYIWWRKRKRQAAGKKVQEAVVQTSTELVIDGFQGSANGFAVAAFKQNQTKYVQLAHHMHSPVEIIKAIEQKIPVLLVIREPVGAVISLTSRWHYVSVNRGLESYIKFYDKLSCYDYGYVVSTFEQTTQQLDRTVARINAKFNTNFELINMAEAQSRHKPKKITRDVQFQIKQQKKQELTRPKNTQLLAKANQVYRQFEMLAIQDRISF